MLQNSNFISLPPWIIDYKKRAIRITLIAPFIQILILNVSPTYPTFVILSFHLASQGFC